VSGESLKFKVEGWKLRVGGLRVTSFFKVLCFRHFAKQNNLPPYFFIKRLPDFSAIFLIWGCGLKTIVQHFFGLLRCSVHVHTPIGMHMHTASSTAAREQ
jgi:hypothetical protein